ncbi:MAG: gamma-glutamylcyclotransferase family protein [Leclercia adecarboxylata]|nr:gamma-glutamylcyclotransferase family protein [Leclercia adecarboxylata]
MSYLEIQLLSGVSGGYITGNRVQGFLFTSENLLNHWHILDEFEGYEYERVPVEVTISTGQTVQSCIYMLKA